MSSESIISLINAILGGGDESNRAQILVVLSKNWLAGVALMCLVEHTTAYHDATISMNQYINI
jgi:hypothetical protein